MSTEEKYLIFDRGGATYVGELSHGFKPPISIHIPRFYVIDCKVQWDFVMDILGVFLGLVQSEGCHEVARVKTSNVHQNGALYPVSKSHIIYP